MEQDGQHHLELDLELPAENRQEEQDIITITDDEETEVLHGVQAELELEAEPELEAERERQAEPELEAESERQAEPELEAEPQLGAQDSNRQEDQEIITITDDEGTEVLHELQVESQVRAEDDNDVITISDDEETEALKELQADPEVRCAQAQATHQAGKAGGSGLKKRKRNVQRESSLKAKRPKLSCLPSANANKRYSCHICDSTFHLRAQLKNHIENGQHQMDQSVQDHQHRKSSTPTRENHNSSTSTTTASSANQNESLEDFLKRYERRWFEENGEFIFQERESNSDPSTSEENLDDDNIWIKEQWP